MIRTSRSDPLRIGGGAFGNHDAWIDQATERALGLAGDAALDVRFVRRPDARLRLT